MKKIVFFLLIIFSLAAGARARAQPLRLAVAANAQFVIKALQADFKNKTGIVTEAIVGSSGNLTAQVKNGAPFDIFLSADMHYPEQLFKEGFAITKPREYALGSLIVCSSRDLDVKNWRNLITGNDIKNIALANPALAPYGRAAEDVLRHYGLWEKVNSKLVYGESISQVNTYITTGVVHIGFTTEALIYEYPGKDKLKWVRVDKNIYGKIRQGLIILSFARKSNYTKALKFYNYILSPAAKQILLQYGYQVS
jgi:molybdate transport system substrate-binding protein